MAGITIKMHGEFAIDMVQDTKKYLILSLIFYNLQNLIHLLQEILDPLITSHGKVHCLNLGIQLINTMKQRSKSG